MSLSLRELLLLSQKEGEAEFVWQVPPFVLIRKHKPRPSWGGATRAITNKTRTGEIEDELFVNPELLEAIFPPLGASGGSRELSIGRLEDNDLVLDEASVSLHHALVAWDASSSRARITDFTSTNGVALNGKPLDAAADVLLSDGDVLSLGEVHLRYFTAKALYRVLRDLPQDGALW